MLEHASIDFRMSHTLEIVLLHLQRQLSSEIALLKQTLQVIFGSNSNIIITLFLRSLSYQIATLYHLVNGFWNTVCSVG